MKFIDWVERNQVAIAAVFAFGVALIVAWAVIKLASTF